MGSPLSPSEVDYVLFHYPCPDGLGAAFVAWHFLSRKYPDRKIIYTPISNGKDVPEDIDGRNLLIVDFSFSLPIIRKILNRVKSLLIIDHHKSAEKELALLESQYKIFDMKHSGAYLTWQYFYNITYIPLLIKYIEDRDLWKNEYNDVAQFASWFTTLIGPPVPSFDILIPLLDDVHFKRMIATRGIAFQELNAYYVNQAAYACDIKFMKIKDKLYLIGYKNVSIPSLKTDVGMKLLQNFPSLDFVVTYSISGDGTSFSLRSTSTGADVSEIATIYGGGGHACASGVFSHEIMNKLPGKAYQNGHKVYESLKSLKIVDVTINEVVRHILCCYSTSNNDKIAKYLLQHRNQAVAQMTTRIDAAVVWCYDVCDNRQIVNVKAICEKDMSAEDRSEFDKVLRTREFVEKL